MHEQSPPNLSVKLTRTGRVSKARSSREIGDAWVERNKAKGLVRVYSWVPADRVDQVRAFVKSLSENRIRVLAKPGEPK